MHILHFQGRPTIYGLHPHFSFLQKILHPFSPMIFQKYPYKLGWGREVKILNILGERPSDLKFYSWDYLSIYYILGLDKQFWKAQDLA